MIVAGPLTFMRYFEGKRVIHPSMSVLPADRIAPPENLPLSVIVVDKATRTVDNLLTQSTTFNQNKRWATVGVLLQPN